MHQMIDSNVFSNGFTNFNGSTVVGWTCVTKGALDLRLPVWLRCRKWFLAFCIVFRLFPVEKWDSTDPSIESSTAYQPRNAGSLNKQWRLPQHTQLISMAVACAVTKTAHATVQCWLKTNQGPGTFRRWAISLGGPNRVAFFLWCFLIDIEHLNDSHLYRDYQLLLKLISDAVTEWLVSQVLLVNHIYLAHSGEV